MVKMIVSERISRSVQVSHLSAISLDSIEWIDCAIANQPRQRFTAEDDRDMIVSLIDRYGFAMVIWNGELHNLTQPVRDLQTLSVKVKE